LSARQASAERARFRLFSDAFGRLRNRMWALVEGLAVVLVIFILVFTIIDLTRQK